MWETERVKLQWFLLNFNYPTAAVNRRERRMNRIPRRNGFFSTSTVWFPESAMLKLSPRLQKEATLSEEILILKGTWLSITGVEWFSSLSSPQNVLCLSHRQEGRGKAPALPTAQTTQGFSQYQATSLAKSAQPLISSFLVTLR